MEKGVILTLDKTSEQALAACPVCFMNEFDYDFPGGTIYG
jgi:hypothetical protein